MTPHDAGGGFDRKRFRAGDPALFRHLVRETSPRMLRVIRGYARDDDHAADLLQVCWIRIYRKRVRFSGTGSFLGWALTVCRNVCRTEVRKRRPGPLVRLDDRRDLPDRTPGPAEQLKRQERAAALYAALERLRVRERDAILLRIIEGRSTAEVARMLAVKEVSVRSLIHRGLKKLRRMDWLADKPVGQGESP